MQSHTIFRPSPSSLADEALDGVGLDGRSPEDATLEAVLERVASNGRDVIYTAVRRMRVGPLANLPAGTTVFPQVLWREAHGDAMYAGLGAVVALEARQPEDLAHVVDRCRAVAAGHPAPDAGLHRIFGGFAFDRADPRDPRWPRGKGWQARFMLPEIALRQRPGDGDDADVAIRVKVLEGMTAAEVERRVDELAGRLEDWRDAGAIAARARGRHAAGRATWRRPHPRQGRDRWIAAVERATREIAYGGFSKVVLSRDIDLTTHVPPDAGEVFERIAAGCPGTHRFMFRFDADAAFLGASPERLLGQDELRVDVDCLAGTAPRGATAEDDVAKAAALAASPKDAAEHDLVVSSVVGTLRPFCSALEAPERPEIVALPTVFHLRTPVVGRLVEDAAPLGRLVAALHPTPAVSGIPATDAPALIRLLEGRPRGWYGGAVGWIGADCAELAVAIRCMVLHPDGATLTVGAGIVEGSTALGEWEETEHKAASLLRLLEGAGP